MIQKIHIYKVMLTMMYIYTHLFYIMPSYILCAFRAPISCKYININIYIYFWKMLWYSVDVMWCSCAQCAHTLSWRSSWNHSHECRNTQTCHCLRVQVPCLGLGHFPSSSSHPEGPGIEMFQSYIFSVRIETASLLFFQIILYIEKSSILIGKNNNSCF